MMRMPSTLATAALVVGLAMASADTATAEPVGVTGFLTTQPFGAETSSTLTLTFPGFSVTVNDRSFGYVTPGFCIICPNGSPVPFTQQIGPFSTESAGGIFGLDATVTGFLSFVGPTDAVAVEDCCTQELDASVAWSGFITVQQGRDSPLFAGPLSGTGSAVSLYSFDPRRGIQWDQTRYSFVGASTSATPEPASLLLLGTGIVGLATRGRRATARG